MSLKHRHEWEAVQTVVEQTPDGDETLILHRCPICGMARVEVDGALSADQLGVTFTDEGGRS